MKKNSYTKNVSFIQNAIPGLEAGEYELTVSQSVSDATGPVSGEPDIKQYYLSVRGDRFSLTNPAGTIDSVFPAGFSTGDFSTVFPHVVFCQKTLPWLRSPTNSSPVPDARGDVPTWLWVMLLDENDSANFPALTLKPLSSKLVNLFPVQAVPTSTLPAGTNSYFTSATDTKDLDPGQQVSDPIKTIDIPGDLFAQLAPTLNDLRLLAHVRQVSDAVTLKNVSDPAVETGTFSIVFGNRLPATNTTTHAYLVSLEGLADFLPADHFTAPANNIRLAVLKYWTFTSMGENAAFVDRLKNVNGNTGTTKSTINSGLVAGGYTGNKSVIKNALAMGYVPLTERMRTGEDTTSWYRGPLVAVPYSTAPTFKLPVSSPDQITIFDPTMGMLDVSYAAAWTLGRMLSIQQQSFSTGLYKWKMQIFQDVRNMIEQELIKNKSSISIGSDPVTSLLKDTILAIPISGKKNTEILSSKSATRKNKPNLKSNNIFSRDELIDKLNNAGTDPAVIQFLADKNLPDDLFKWLENTSLLKGVPFNYLIPDESMLPPETIRFFYFDKNWQNALMDGALSIGRNLDISDDGSANDSLEKIIIENILTGLSTTSSAAASSDLITGFILRSAIVKDYPGIGVNAYASVSNPESPQPELPLLRMEVVGKSSDILICIADGKIVQADIHEAPQGLHYGIDSFNDTGQPIPTKKIYPTFTKDSDSNVHFGDNAKVDIASCFRSASPRTMQVSILSQKLAAVNISPFNTIFDAAQIGYVMTEGVGMVSFTNKKIESEI